MMYEKVKEWVRTISPFSWYFHCPVCIYYFGLITIISLNKCWQKDTWTFDFIYRKCFWLCLSCFGPNFKISTKYFKFPQILHLFSSSIRWPGVGDIFVPFPISENTNKSIQQPKKETSSIINPLTKGKRRLW